MPVIKLNEAKANLSRLVDAAAGEEIITVARLAPVENLAPCQPGIAKGRVNAAFFEPLPERERSA